jgi:hypothetical protein
LLLFIKETKYVPQHATSYAGMELIAYGGTDTHHGRKILRRKIQREGRRASRTVTVSHAPTRRAFPSVRFDHLIYFHNRSRRRENRQDTSVLLFSSISYSTRSRLFLFLLAIRPPLRLFRVELGGALLTTSPSLSMGGGGRWSALVHQSFPLVLYTGAC